MALTGTAVEVGFGWVGLGLVWFCRTIPFYGSTTFFLSFFVVTYVIPICLVFVLVFTVAFKNPQRCIRMIFSKYFKRNV